MSKTIEHEPAPRRHRRPRWLPSPAMAVALLALCLAAGGVAVAAIPDASGVIHGCYENTTGALRVTDTQDAVPRACSPSETALPWVEAGPQGPPGQTGPQGAAGPAGVSTAYTTSGLFSKDKFVRLKTKKRTIALLNVPAGDYFVIAKADVYLHDGEGPTHVTKDLYYADPEAHADCDLAGGDPDAAELRAAAVVVTHGKPGLDDSSSTTMTLTGTPDFAPRAGGSLQITLRCSGSEGGLAPAAAVSHVKLTALRVGSVVRQPTLVLPTVKPDPKVVLRLKPPKHKLQRVVVHP